MKNTALILFILVIFASCQKADEKKDDANEVTTIEQEQLFGIQLKPVEPEPKPLIGVITDTRVRLRSEPNLDSETLGYLNTGDKIKFLDKSAEKQKIDDMEAYWCKGQVEGYPEGWVYGAFIDFINVGNVRNVRNMGVEIAISEETSVTEPVPFENIRYFEKIRWRLRYSGFTSGGMRMTFSIPPAKTYYKMKYELSREDKPTFYELLGNDDTSFFTISKPERKYKNYVIPGFGSLPKDATKVTNTDVDSIEGKYIPNSTESDWAYYILAEVTEIEKYIGYADLTYNEIGNHFISYDPTTATFTSDNTFGEEFIEELIEVFEKLYSVDRNRLINSVLPVTPYTNDDFTLQVISYGHNNEKILLKTNQYELGCIPEELLINPGDKCNFFMSSAERIYENPNMSSVSISIEDVEEFAIMERQTKWEEINEEMSMWYRIRTEKGDEGWVWGRDIYLDEAAHSVWY